MERIGLCGSHRTGKTTLGEAVARERNIPFVRTRVSDVFRQNSLHPSDSMDFNTRLQIQQRIIADSEAVWKSEKGDFVTDRTPIDMMAYTLSDIQGATAADFHELEKYLTHCFEISNQIFTLLCVIQPAIPLVYEQGKAALNLAYMEHLNAVILGLCHDERLKCPAIVIRRECIRIEDRVAAVFK
jgi:hypothetical protein